MRVTPTAIPTVVQSGPHIANMLAVVAADLAADNERPARRLASAVRALTPRFRRFDGDDK